MVLKTKSSVVLLLLFCVLTISCSERKATLPTVDINAEILPTTHGEDITSLVSTEGITRYRLEAKIWDMYSGGKEPYWYFPKGVYVEQFDSIFNVEASIIADTAYFFEDRKLWQLIGNVRVKNLQGYIFDTSELFWDQKADTSSYNSIYTDKFVQLQREGTIYHSYGFRSNQSLTQYIFIDFDGEFPVEESTDSLQTKP